MIRFIFEHGNNRIEEFNEEAEITDVLYADGGTIEGYFNTWKKSDREFDTIEELEEYILQISYK